MCIHVCMCMYIYIYIYNDEYNNDNNDSNNNHMNDQVHFRKNLALAAGISPDRIRIKDCILITIIMIIVVSFVCIITIIIIRIIVIIITTNNSKIVVIISIIIGCSILHIRKVYLIHVFDTSFARLRSPIDFFSLPVRLSCVPAGMRWSSLP